ncbi:non-ribosomal peptide synthetase [Streptomyces sp. NPDC015131]|uniref:non-ribosomal peptide synthetase n=1 Tax=Streptomyces sp. NPDC015131 TaxID=3364941 RepID=UPI0036F9D8BB
MLSITGQYLARYRDLAARADSPVLLPVTGAQRRFILVRSLDPQGRPDLVPMFFAFPRGTVDTGRLAAAAEHLAVLHPVLRSRPTVVRGTPVLRVERPEVPVVRVAREPGEDARAALRRALRAWAPDGPPLRLYLAEDGEPVGGRSADGDPMGGRSADERPVGVRAADGDARGREVLAVVLDHTACDGRSLARIVEELGAAYAEAGRTARPGAAAAGTGPYTAAAIGPATGPDVDDSAELAAYRDAVLLQLDAEERAASPDALAYWGDRLRAVQDRAPVPPPGEPGAGAAPSGSASARVPAPPAGVPFPELLAACRPAVRALYGPGHVVPLGYPWGGRPAGAERVLGCFLNTVVFPAVTAAAPICPEVTADAWWDDLDRADVPFDAVVRAAREAGSGWSGRLDGMLTVDDAAQRPPLRLGGVEGREVDVDGRPVRGPFAVSVTQGPELRVRMVWDRAVIADDTARTAFDALTDALGAAARAAAAPAAPETPQSPATG